MAEPRRSTRNGSLDLPPDPNGGLGSGAPSSAVSQVGSDGFLLSFEGAALPEYPILHQPYPINLTVVNAGNRSSGADMMWERMPVTWQLLHYEGAPVSNPEAAVLMDPAELYLDSSGCCRFMVTFTQLTVDNKGQPYQLVFSLPPPVNPHSKLGRSKSRPLLLFSPPLRVVRWRLMIVAEDVPPRFFKDQGGKEKCMAVDVRLVDTKGKVVPAAQNLQLSARLYYHEGEDAPKPVVQQDILNIKSTRQQMRIGADGQASVRFRVEDVSKNHQGKEFRVQVCGAKPELVAPVLSKPVLILSKINKNRKKRQLERKLFLAQQGGVPMDDDYDLDDEEDEEEALPAPLVLQPLGGGAGAGAPGAPGARLSGRKRRHSVEASESGLLKRSRFPLGGVALGAQGAGAQGAGGAMNPDPVLLQMLAHQMTPWSAQEDFPASAAVTGPGGPVPAPWDPVLLERLRGEDAAGLALHNVLGWSEAALVALRGMEWRLVGADANAGGDAGPVYRCPCCWAFRASDSAASSTASASSTGAGAGSSAGAAGHAAGGNAEGSSHLPSCQLYAVIAGFEAKVRPALQLLVAVQDPEWAAGNLGALFGGAAPSFPLLSGSSGSSSSSAASGGTPGGSQSGLGMSSGSGISGSGISGSGVSGSGGKGLAAASFLHGRASLPFGAPALGRRGSSQSLSPEEEDAEGFMPQLHPAFHAQLSNGGLPAALHPSLRGQHSLVAGANAASRTTPVWPRRGSDLLAHGGAAPSGSSSAASSSSGASASSGSAASSGAAPPGAAPAAGSNQGANAGASQPSPSAGGGSSGSGPSGIVTSPRMTLFQRQSSLGAPQLSAGGLGAGGYPESGLLSGLPLGAPSLANFGGFSGVSVGLAGDAVVHSGSMLGSGLLRGNSLTRQGSEDFPGNHLLMLQRDASGGGHLGDAPGFLSGGGITRQPSHSHMYSAFPPNMLAAAHQQILSSAASSQLPPGPPHFQGSLSQSSQASQGSHGASGLHFLQHSIMGLGSSSALSSSALSSSALSSSAAALSAPSAAAPASVSSAPAPAPEAKLKEEPAFPEA